MAWYWIVTIISAVWIGSAVVVAVLMSGLAIRLHQAERALIVSPPLPRPKSYHERLKAEYAKRGIPWIDPKVTTTDG